MSDWQGGMADQLAKELVADVVANPGCDVMERLAVPLPIRMIAHIIGIPPEDVQNFRSWSEDGVGVINAGVSPPAGLRQGLKGVRAIAALRRYFKDQLASGKLKGGSDTVLVGSSITTRTASSPTTSSSSSRCSCYSLGMKPPPTSSAGCSTPLPTPPPISSP